MLLSAQGPCYSGSEVIFADRARFVSAEFFSAAAVFEIWLARLHAFRSKLIQGPARPAAKLAGGSRLTEREEQAAIQQRLRLLPRHLHTVHLH